MKQILVRILTAASVATCLTASVRAATFDDIQFWVGSGANRAALVIDWGDGKSAESLLWGYRWDGAANGLAMFQAVVSADPRLFAHLGNYGWGTAVQGIGYDLNGSGGFAVAPALAFDAGGLALSTSPDDARAASDPADHWLEGWNSGFWAYYLKDSGNDPWASAMVGAADRVLADGNWDGWRFAPGFVGPAPAEPSPAPVPEPATAALLTLGALALAWQRRARS